MLAKSLLFSRRVLRPSSQTPQDHVGHQLLRYNPPRHQGIDLLTSESRYFPYLHPKVRVMKRELYGLDLYCLLSEQICKSCKSQQQSLRSRHQHRSKSWPTSQVRRGQKESLRWRFRQQDPNPRREPATVLTFRHHVTPKKHIKENETIRQNQPARLLHAHQDCI